MRACALVLGLLGACSLAAEAQTAPLRVLSISGVSPAHAWTPHGVDVLRVRVENTTGAPSRPAAVHCTLGVLALRGPVPTLPPRSDRWITLSLPRAQREEVPAGGTFASCRLDAPGDTETTDMVYTGPALVPNLRFDRSGVQVRDCATDETPAPSHAVCVYLAVENTEQTIGPIGDVPTVTRCTVGSVRREETRTLRELTTGRTMFDLGRLPRGPHRLECRADADDAVQESEEGDNVVRVDFRVEHRVEHPVAGRLDIALDSMRARFVPWRGHEYPQPDHVRLYVELRNVGDARITTVRVECTVDGARIVLFDGRPRDSLGPGETMWASDDIRSVARGESPPSHVSVECSAHTLLPARSADASPGDNVRAERLTVER
jgi:hypothetical protein